MIMWDPNKGRQIGWEQAVDENGEPQVDDLGNPVQSDIPMFEGQLTIELVPAFNVLRDPDSDSIQASPYLIVRKMMDVNELKKMVKDKEIMEKIQASDGHQFKVFDTNTGSYRDAENQTELRYHFYRPSKEYPNGYFFVATEYGVISEGDIPFGDELREKAFPVQYAGYEKYPTMCRARAMIRHLKPYQVEINRSASYIAQTQITYKTKAFIQSGSKVSKAYQKADTDFYNIAGPSPTVISGQSGEQYEGYLLNLIDEMYKNSPYLNDLDELNDKSDPFALLFKRMSQRHKSTRYVKKFSRFLIQMCETYLLLAKRYYDDERIIRAIGRREAVNIAEFKSIQDEDFQIQLEPMSQDIESAMGRQLQINQLLQYVGQTIPEETLGRLIKHMPFLNDDPISNDLTLEDDNIESDILALDRGEYRPPMPHDDHVRHVKRFTHRTRQNDFKLLPPEIQQLYHQRIAEHNQMESEQAEELRRRQAEFIPMDGPTTKFDFKDPRTGERAEVPFVAAQWLVEQLEKQGLTQERLQQLSVQNQIDILSQGQVQAPQGLPTDPSLLF